MLLEKKMCSLILEYRTNLLYWLRSNKVDLNLNLIISFINLVISVTYFFTFYHELMELS